MLKKKRSRMNEFSGKKYNLTFGKRQQNNKMKKTLRKKKKYIKNINIQ